LFHEKVKDAGIFKQGHSKNGWVLRPLKVPFRVMYFVFCLFRFASALERVLCKWQNNFNSFGFRFSSYENPLVLKKIFFSVEFFQSTCVSASVITWRGGRFRKSFARRKAA
jgi:hypothetical protein